MASFGYVDERGEYALEGFSIALRGVGGAFEIIPTSLLYPGLGGEPSNLARVTVRLRAESFVAEAHFDFLLAVIHRLESDLEGWSAGSADGLVFPSPQVVVLLETWCRCEIAKGGPGPSDWRMDCELSEGPDDCRKALKVRLSLDPSSVSNTRDELAAFLIACQQANATG
jgi:hypothetical protein